jgi:S1-C subfamily serine protease
LVGHAAGSSDGSSDGGTIVVGSDDDARGGYIGVVGTDARRREGALILEVLPGSPAERAGLARGDLVMTAGDFDITSMRALARAIRATAPGRAIELGLLRGDQRFFVEVEVAQQPTDVLGPPG